MGNILICSPVDAGAIEELRRHHDVDCFFDPSPEALRSRVPWSDVLVLRSGTTLSAEVIQAAKSLRLVIRAGSGVDNIDLVSLREHGIRLVRVQGPGARAVAELTFAFMLGLARQVLPAHRSLSQGEWRKNTLTGHLLEGKTLGIVGCGNIGAKVGELGGAWGMRPIGCVASPSRESESRLSSRGIIQKEFEQVLSLSDFVSVHVPLLPSTLGLIDAPALALMKPGAFLVNMARGGVVDERALYRELTKAGRLAGAALDVHSEEGPGKISQLAGLSNVILTPHIGSTTVESQRQIGRKIVETVDAVFRGGEAPKLESSRRAHNDVCGSEPMEMI